MISRHTKFFDCNLNVFGTLCGKVGTTMKLITN